MADPAAALETGRRKEFRRMVVVSIFVHLFALGLVVSNPASRVVAPPQMIAVELVSDPSKPRKPAPVAQPSRPKPAPKPKPKPAKTLLPEKPRDPKPEASKPPERRKEVFLDPAAKQEKSLDDLLADFRDEQGEPEPAAAPEPVQTAAVPTAGATTGARISPEVADWMRRTKLHVKRAWVVQPGFRMQTLTTHVMVRLDAAGNVVGEPEITRRSGNPWYDESVVRGIVKASPLPAPPEADEWPFIFRPEDSF